MNYPSPPPSPPPYAKTSTVCPPDIAGMDHLFNLQRGAKWDLRRFCNALHRARSKASQYGIRSIQHRTRLDQDAHHECLILDVVPLVPGTNAPQPDHAPHTLIEVGGVCDETSLFGIWGVAADEVGVTVLRREDEACLLQQAAEGFRGGSRADTPINGPAGELLATLSWDLEIPNLLDVCVILTSLSLTCPKYTLFTCPCVWLAHAIYEALKHGYRPVGENMGDSVWKRTRFLMVAWLFTPTPPACIFELCYRQAQWSHLAGLERHLPSSSSSAQP
jgi:hypothetical protein